MGEPFLSEIRIMSFNFPPKGWAFCNGQILPINQNQALFSLLGTTYGGNGQTTFALPELRGRTPIHSGSGHTLGERSGEENHTLSIAEVPTHAHALFASATTANAPVPFGPSGNILASSAPDQIYNPAASLAALNAATVANVGGSQPHTNQQPYLTLSFCIALVGIFPSRN
jgi:microcystin-dependent protein